MSILTIILQQSIIELTHETQSKGQPVAIFHKILKVTLKYHIAFFRILRLIISVTNIVHAHCCNTLRRIVNLWLLGMEDNGLTQFFAQTIFNQ